MSGKHVREMFLFHSATTELKFNWSGRDSTLRSIMSFVMLTQLIKFLHITLFFQMALKRMFYIRTVASWFSINCITEARWLMLCIATCVQLKQTSIERRPIRQRPSSDTTHHSTPTALPSTAQPLVISQSGCSLQVQLYIVPQQSSPQLKWRKPPSSQSTTPARSQGSSELLQENQQCGRSLPILLCLTPMKPQRQPCQLKTTGLTLPSKILFRKIWIKINWKSRSGLACFPKL